MKRITFLYITILCVCLFLGCKNKKYDSASYEVRTHNERFATAEDAYRAELHDRCLTFLNYCDVNHCNDIKRFARDWMRTWEGWETEGIKNIGDLTTCHINTTSHYDVWSVDISINENESPQVFVAELNIFGENYKYDDLLDIMSNQFGEVTAVEPFENGDGIRHKWMVDPIKTVSTMRDRWAISLAIEYEL